MSKLQVIEKQGMRVLTSRQLAKVYDVKPIQIQQNYTNNKKRFRAGKHYVCLAGEELKSFKNKFENFDLVARTANRLYLWTEKGALLHAKSLNTDKAWEAYDYLVDFYFRAKEAEEETKKELPATTETAQITSILSTDDKNMMAYNRGIVLGVLRQELDEDSTLEIFNRLSAHGQNTVMKIVFGEVRL